MIILCGWCKKFMGEKDGPADWVTHGICPECRAAEEASWAPGTVASTLTEDETQVQHEDQDGNALVGLGMAIILSLPIWVAIFRLIARCVR